MEKVIDERESFVQDLQEKESNPYQHITLMRFCCEFPDQTVAVRIHDSGRFCGYHCHEFYEINYVVRGSCIELVDEDMVPLEEGAFLMMHPGTYHTVYTQDGSVIYNILFRASWFEQRCEWVNGRSAFAEFAAKAGKAGYYPYIVCPAGALGKGEHFIKQMIRQAKKDDPQWTLQMESAALQFLSCVLAESEGAYFGAKNEPESSLKSDMLIYMSRYSNTLTLDSMAEQFGYSSSYLSRLFKKEMGMGFSQKLAEIRIRHATVMLVKSNMTVNEIAGAVGFDSVEHFHRKFKKMIGVTPVEYRKGRGDLFR